MWTRNVQQVFWAPFGESFGGDGDVVESDDVDDNLEPDDDIGDDDDDDQVEDEEGQGDPPLEVEDDVQEDEGDDEPVVDDDAAEDDDQDDDSDPDLEAFRARREELLQRRGQQRQDAQTGVTPEQVQQYFQRQFQINPIAALNQMGISNQQINEHLLQLPADQGGQQDMYDVFGNPIQQPSMPPGYQQLQQQVQQQQQLIQQMTQTYNQQQQQQQERAVVNRAQLLLTNAVKEMPLLGLHGENTANALAKRIHDFEELTQGPASPRDMLMIARDLDDSIYSVESEYLRTLANMPQFADIIDASKLGVAKKKTSGNGKRQSRLAGKSRGGKAPKVKSPEDMTEEELERHAWKEADLARKRAEQKSQ